MRNRSRRRTLGTRIAVADRPWSRLRGLLGRPPLEDGEGMLFDPSRGVHMWGMKHPLDVLLISAERRVVGLYPELQPWKRTRMDPYARFALELPVGTIARTRTEVGDRLGWGPAPRPSPTHETIPPGHETIPPGKEES